MPVDGRAQVVHDALADLCGEEGLDDAERGREHGDHDHPAREERDQRRVAVRDPAVEQRAEEERGDGAEPGRNDDQAQDEPEAGLVGPEEPGQPAQVQPADDRVGRPLGRLPRCIEESLVWSGHYDKRTCEGPSRFSNQ